MTTKVLNRLKTRGITTIEICEGVFGVIAEDVPRVLAAMSDQRDFLKWFNRGYAARLVPSDSTERRWRLFGQRQITDLASDYVSVFANGDGSARFVDPKATTGVTRAEVAAGATAIFGLKQPWTDYPGPPAYRSYYNGTYLFEPSCTVTAVRLGKNVWAGTGRWPGFLPPSTPSSVEGDQINNGWWITKTDWPRSKVHPTEYLPVYGSESIGNHDVYGVRAEAVLSYTVSQDRIISTTGVRSSAFDSRTLRLVTGPQYFDWGEVCTPDGGATEGVFFIGNASLASAMVDSITEARSRGLATSVDVMNVEAQADKVRVTEGGIGCVRFGRMSPWYLDSRTRSFADKIVDQTGQLEGFDFDLLRVASQTWSGFSVGGSLEAEALKELFGTEPVAVALDGEQVVFSTSNYSFGASQSEAVKRAGELKALNCPLVRGTDKPSTLPLVVVGEVLAAPALEPVPFDETDPFVVCYGAGLFLGRPEANDKGTHPGLVYCKPLYLEPRST